MEDDLQWKTTFDGRQLSMEDDLRLKMTFDGRQPLMEDNLRWKTTFDGRQPLMEGNIWWKTTFDGRRPLCSSSIFHSVLFELRAHTLCTHCPVVPAPTVSTDHSHVVRSGYEGLGLTSSLNTSGVDLIFVQQPPNPPPTKVYGILGWISLHYLSGSVD